MLSTWNSLTSAYFLWRMFKKTKTKKDYWVHMLQYPHTYMSLIQCLGQLDPHTEKYTHRLRNMHAQTKTHIRTYTLTHSQSPTTTTQPPTHTHTHTHTHTALCYNVTIQAQRSRLLPFPVLFTLCSVRTCTMSSNILEILTLYPCTCALGEGQNR